jgi:3-hydroxyisobutyrate dehydrogenase-like beta-hydroxyacid dehydrogenase
MVHRHLGFVGVGRMGGAMAGRLIDAGYRLTIHDVNESVVAPLVARGARAMPSPAAVASKTETVLVSLPTPEVVRAVALSRSGIAEGTAVKTFIDLSTTGPRVAAEVAKTLGAKGITAVDAPVSGGPVGALKGTLAVMVAGPCALVERLTPMLEVLGRIFFIGERPGMGQTMKLVNNLLSATALAATSEAMVMGAKAGLDAGVMLDVINAGSGRNSATQDKFPRCVLPRRFDFGFTHALLHKDVRLCLDEAMALGLPMPIGSTVGQMLMLAMATEGANADITTLVRTREQWAGVEVSGATARDPEAVRQIA